LVRALEYREVVSDREGRRVDRGARVRAEVVEVLAESEDPRATDALVRGLRDDTSYVRLKAIEAVRGRRDDRVLEALAADVGGGPPEPDATALRGELESLDPVRAKALDALLELGDRRVPQRIAAHMAYREGEEPLTETDEWAFRAALAAVPDGGGAELAASIAALLGHERPEVRDRAQAILRWMGPASVEPLIAALTQPSRRGLAIAPLGELGDSRAVRPLLDVLSDRDPGVRSAAARALGEIRHPGCVEGLMLASHDDEQGVRREAMAALDKLGTAAVVVAMHDLFEAVLVRLRAAARHTAETRAQEASSAREEASRTELDPGQAETKVAPPAAEERETPAQSDAAPPDRGRTTMPRPGPPSADGEPRRTRGDRVRSQLRRRLFG
jgi:HEAT repeat protein